jgi:hypothetical protein
MENDIMKLGRILTEGKHPPNSNLHFRLLIAVQGVYYGNQGNKDKDIATLVDSLKSQLTSVLSEAADIEITNIEHRRQIENLRLLLKQVAFNANVHMNQGRQPKLARLDDKTHSWSVKIHATLEDAFGPVAST